MNSTFGDGILINMPQVPVDPLANAMKLLSTIVRDLLKAFPFLVGGLTLILFIILAILMFLFQGTIIQP